MRIAAIALLALAGCASTPSELRTDGARRDFTLSMSPAQAAACLARNAENAASGVTTAVRIGATSGTHEVVVSRGEPIAVADVTPADRGARATIWRAHVPILPTGLPEAMAKGC